MVRVKVLGPGCANCERLARVVAEAVAELALEASVEKVSSLSEMIEYGIMSTPALVIDDHVVCSGRVPLPVEIRTWLRAGTPTSRR